jgi:Cu(I)/Ag(I) efflux system periplasmic protein CusF
MYQSVITIFTLLLLLQACGGSTQPRQRVSSATPAPMKTPFVPKNGDYFGKGKITKINNDLGSVELDHEEIKDVMPAMQMEFFVSDKALLKGLKLGDEVDFTLRYNNGQETIIAINKSK